jgi:hypothetical protein
MVGDADDGLPACVILSQPSTANRAKPATVMPSITRRRGLRRWLRRWANFGRKPVTEPDGADRTIRLSVKFAP